MTAIAENSVTWYFVNRASKFWQENWEKHVNLLEGTVVGPLYETVLSDADIRFRKLEGPYPFSVSKLNQILSLFVLALFVMLVGATLLSYYCCSWPPNVLAVITVMLTAVAVWYLYWKGRAGWWDLSPEQRVNHAIAHRLTTILPAPPAKPPEGDKTK